MFNAVTNKRLEEIIEITEKLEGSGLKDEVINSLNEELEDLADYLGVNKESAVFFAVIFTLQNKEFSQVSLHEIADFLDYPFIQLLASRVFLNQLEDAGLISLKQIRNSSPHSENNGYNISGTIMNCVIDGIPIVKIEPAKETTETVLDEILRIQNVFSNREMTLVEYNLQIETCEKKHSENIMVKNIKRLFPDDFDSRMILYNLLCENITGMEFPSSSEQDNPFSILPRSSVLKRRTSLNDDSDVLIERNLVRKNFEMNGDFRGRRSPTVSYMVTANGLKEILGEEADKYGTTHQEWTETDITLQTLHEIAYEFESRRNCLPVKKNKIRNFEVRNRELKFFKKISECGLDEDSRFLLYDFVNDYLSGSNSSLSATLSDLYGKGKNYFTAIRSFLDEKHQLIQENFVDLNKEDIVERSTISITDKTLEFLYGEYADIYKRTSTANNVYLPEKIKEKKLFYSEDVQNQIDMLSESLSKGNFEAMQKRLGEKGLCKGVAVILYGAPGTGKTESVYQIAKKTNRQIMHVDIADSKSMWFGESEKQIKKIFTKYRSLCKSCKGHNQNTPILLFNEADAIISKRKDISASSCGQTENAMQNILLEEMEKLDGIMIATTNLCENMDKAFERRFLFKIKFEKPTTEARLLIWKNKMPDLDETSARKLADDFDFSGGEIDNIVRKSEMNEIIKGEKPGYELLKDFCNKERLEKEENHRMGFSV